MPQPTGTRSFDTYGSEHLERGAIPEAISLLHLQPCFLPVGGVGTPSSPVCTATEMRRFWGLGSTPCASQSSSLPLWGDHKSNTQIPLSCTPVLRFDSEPGKWKALKLVPDATVTIEVPRVAL